MHLLAVKILEIPFTCFVRDAHINDDCVNRLFIQSGFGHKREKRKYLEGKCQLQGNIIDLCPRASFRCPIFVTSLLRDYIEIMLFCGLPSALS